MPIKNCPPGSECNRCRQSHLRKTLRIANRHLWMDMIDSSPPKGVALRRRRFGNSQLRPTGNTARVLQLLIAQDGSTTKLCEAVAGGPVVLIVHTQELIREVPADMQSALPSARILRRISSLVMRGEVMLDSLSYLALDALPGDACRDLESGAVPIGHVLKRLWVRRSFMSPSASFYTPLWDAVGLADIAASRTYCIATSSGPCMVVAETFRHGMLMGL